MTGNYGPAAAGAAVRNCNNPYARTIYIGGFPEGPYIVAEFETSANQQEPMSIKF